MHRTTFAVLLHPSRGSVARSLRGYTEQQPEAMLFLIMQRVQLKHPKTGVDVFFLTVLDFF